MITGTMQMVVAVSKATWITGEPTVVCTESQMTPIFPGKWHDDILRRPNRIAKPHLLACVKNANRCIKNTSLQMRLCDSARAVLHYTP